MDGAAGRERRWRKRCRSCEASSETAAAPTAESLRASSGRSIVRGLLATRKQAAAGLLAELASDNNEYRVASQSAKATVYPCSPFTVRSRHRLRIRAEANDEEAARAVLRAGRCSETSCFSASEQPFFDFRVADGLGRLLGVGLASG
jgi:hypothetical protein